MAAAAILKITKIAISRNGFTDLYEIWYGGVNKISSYSSNQGGS